MEFGVCIPNSPFSERIAYSLNVVKHVCFNFFLHVQIFMILQMDYHRETYALTQNLTTSRGILCGLWESINARFRVHEGYTLLLPNYKIFIARFFFSVVWYLKRSELSILSSYFQNDYRKEQNFLQRENVKALQKEDCKTMGVVWKLLEPSAATGVIAVMKQMDRNVKNPICGRFSGHVMGLIWLIKVAWESPTAGYGDAPELRNR